MAGTVRVGVIGCGAIATAVHLRALRSLAGFELRAVADPSPDALARALRMVRGATGHRDPGELLDRQDLDAVVIAAPSGRHATLAIAALERRRHLYLEKPIATTLEDGQRVVDAAATADVVAMCGFNWRFQPLIRRAGELLRGGAIGPVRHVRSAFLEPATVAEWKRRRADGGGVLLDLGSHHFDLIPWLLEARIVGVEAEIRSIATEHDNATVRLQLDQGRGATCDFSLTRGPAHWFEFIGERGTLRVDRVARTLAIEGARARTWDRAILAWRAQAVLRPRAEPSWRAALAAFRDRIRGGRCPIPDLTDGWRSLDTVAAAERAAGVA